MKKFIPLIIFVLGIVVLLLVYFLVIKKPGNNESGEDKSDSLIEVSLNDRPVTSLTPTEDGHWLNLKIDKIKIDAQTMDYELLYELPDGRTQGVPGTINLNGQTQIERKLLLGSESSGKFRYDEGVKQGTITLRFRNDKGKMVARFTTKFALLSGTKDISSVDASFKATLNKVPKGFIIVMETFGVPSSPSSEVKFGPYGIFASSVSALDGHLETGSYKMLHYSDSSWQEDSFGSGIFVGVSQ